MFKGISARQLGSSLSRRTVPHRHHPPPQTHSYQPLHGTRPRTLGIAAMASSTHYYSTSVNRIPGRSSVPEEALTNPHHVVKGKGGEVVGFRNPYPSYVDPQTFSNAMRSVFIPLLTGRLRRPETLSPKISVQKPQWLATRSSSPALRATWLGHACYYVEYPSGLRVLFDPVFEDRCSPFRFMGPKRYTRPPCSVADIPVVDAVCISHSHYDHLSHSTVVELKNRHPEAQFFVGLGLEKWFRRCGVENVTEMDWWEDAELHVKTSAGKEVSARISCLPAQHSSGRTGLDRDRTLWVSWAVSSASKSVWFAGDTGYRTVPRLPDGTDDYGAAFESLPRCPQFQQIGDLRGPFDLGLIPIGAYYPRAAFSALHANPFDSVEIFRDTKCKRAMGIHWGTWALTMEKVTDPPAMLREALRRKRIPELGVFDVCDIGESREF